MKKISWGILSTANMGLERAIPAMQQSELCSVDAICSRSLETAQKVAQRFGIPRAYGSYEELLNDPLIDAIYIPLPNHLHVEWTTRAVEAGKHVLCEKPIAMNAAEAEKLIALRDHSGKKIMEAFMSKLHPQWLCVRELIQSGRIGELRAMQGFFSYNNLDPKNVRNRLEIGGGGMMDIGCYLVTMPRFIFGTEPRRVVSLLERDPSMHTDRLSTCILDFPNGQASFSCSTQLARYQRMQFFGTEGRIEIEVPVNAATDRPSRIIVDDGRDLFGGGIEVIEIPPCNQYSIQGDAFSRAILEDTPVPIPLEDAIQNMRVIDAIFRSEKSGQWEQP